MKQFSKQMVMTLTMFLMGLGSIFAQGNLRGMVKDETGEALPGVSIGIEGTTKGTFSDANGSYSLPLARGTSQVVFTYTGFTRSVQTVVMAASDVTLDVVMATSEFSLSEVVISTGARANQRTITDSPLPIDILGPKDLQSTGQTTFDKALQYRVPSFNVVNTPVNDATTLLDPWEIRNLGPSRTLILVNGKRKNLSSLLYVQFSPGRGETGVDLSAIPQDAIKRVEILRDGASAQYGSDAIAGVINVILKDRYDYSSLNIRAGTTTKGDKRSYGFDGNGRGDNYGVSFNSGANYGEKGYLSYTVDLSQQESAVRSGIVDVPTEIATFGDGGGGAQDQLIKAYLTDHPTGNNINGTAETTAAKFLMNGGFAAGELGTVYANAAMVAKKVSSFANYRTAYWRQDRGLLHSTADNGGKNYITAATLAFPEDNPDIYKGYVGYVPTFVGDLIDFNATIGVKDEHNGWKHDVSLTAGSNQQLYTVDNTVNRSLGTNSPTSFKPGGYGFRHLVGNLDVSKSITDAFGIAFGAEARSETYEIIAGDTASYSGQGSNSFPGILSINARTNSRYNIGAYFDVNYDITEDFLINGTVRTENYSDFGNAFVWKLSSRYKLADDKVTVRASASTGFRAPSLHQIYAQSTQASFAGGTIVQSGLFNNFSVAARLLEIPRLKAENSTNITVGLGMNPTKNLNITLDYYQINIKDRIVYSSSISSSDVNSDLYKILQAGDLSSVQFFINGIETNTSGIDFVANYRNIGLGSGKLGVNLAGNMTLVNEIVGSPTDPRPIKAAGSTILNAQIKSLLTEGRPKYKVILGFDYAVGKWGFNLNNTLFGPTKFQDLDNGGSIMNHIKAEFEPAVVTDLQVNYNLTKKSTLSIGISNLLNVVPKWDLVSINAEGAAAIDTPAEKSLLRGFLGFSGRYDILGYNGSQFSQLGTMLNANLNIRF